MTLLRTSPTGGFINAKIQKISAELAASNDDAAGQTKAEVDKKERELIILNRQKKAISDDLDEVLQRYSTIEDAYSSALLTKVVSLFKKRKKAPERSLFAKGVISYYDSIQRPRTNYDYVQKYCHLSAVWLPSASIKCVDLVPKSFESDEIAYLFGVREANLSEARNGITLGRHMWSGLSWGWVVIVPDKPRYGEEAIWRCIVVERSVASQVYSPGLTWKDMDAKALKFLTPNRPARRYLFLRYVMTYLQQQRIGNVEWLDYLKARGHLWGLPGLYLRKSMLLALAKRFSGQGLPDCFYDSTFTVADGCPQRSAEDEDDLAMGLDHKMQYEFAEATRDEDDWSDSSDDEWSDYSDSERRDGLDTEEKWVWWT